MPLHGMATTVNKGIPYLGHYHIILCELAGIMIIHCQPIQRKEGVCNFLI